MKNVQIRYECQLGHHEFEPHLWSRKGSSEMVSQYYCKHCLMIVTKAEHEVFLQSRGLVGRDVQEAAEWGTPKCQPNLEGMIQPLDIEDLKAKFPQKGKAASKKKSTAKQPASEHTQQPDAS